MIDIDLLVCSRAIDSGHFDGATLSTLRARRAIAYRQRGRHRKSIADLDAALVANPVPASARFRRGLTHIELGALNAAEQDFAAAIELFPAFTEAIAARGRAAFLAGDDARAIEHLGSAIARSPHVAEAFAFRAFAHFRQGAFADAAWDLARCIELELNYPYPPLWLNLSIERGGAADPGVLARATSERLTDEWPRALLDVYRGARSAGEIIAVLETAPPAPRERRRYEALFYLARWARRVGEHATAREQLRQVVSLAPPRSVEGLMARHELRTLGR